MVGISPTGKKLAERTFETTTEANIKAIQWAHKTLGGDVLWAVEDSRVLTARLERDLLAAGHKVIRVPPSLSAANRRTHRERGKSDPIDALAVARVVLREPDLPIAFHEPASWELKLLADRRDDLVEYRAAVMQRLLWRVHALDPSHKLKSGALAYRVQQGGARRVPGRSRRGRPGHRTGTR